MKIVTDLTIGGRTVRSGHAFSPILLFSPEQRGAWYDPSDGRRVVTDLAGITMAAPGDPVARIDDKSGNGFHLTQATVAARPIYARHPVSGIRNLLTHSEDLSQSWFLVGPGNPTLSVVGGEQRVSWTSGGGNVYQFPAKTPVAGETWALRFRLKVVDLGGAGPSDFSLSIRDGDQSVSVNQTITLIDDGAWHDYAVDFTFSSPSGVGSYAHFRYSDVGGNSPVIAFEEAQLEVAASASAYQKVTTRYDITEAGQRDLHYLVFDGVDDFLTAGNVLDLGASDRTAAFGVQVFNAGYGSLLSKRGTGSYGSNPGWGLRAMSRRLHLEFDDGASGSTGAIGGAGGLADRAVHVAEIEFGVQARSYRDGSLSASTADISALGDSTGTQEFHIGGKPASYAEMRLYGAVVREGLLTAMERGKAEAFLAQKTGVTT
jgi:hypothetical protein